MKRWLEGEMCPNGYIGARLVPVCMIVPLKTGAFVNNTDRIAIFLFFWRPSLQESIFQHASGMTIGIANIIVGIVIVVIVARFKEEIGLGSLFNMVLIGFYIDLILAANIIPQANSLIIGILAIFSGLFIHSLGTYFYIDSGFGAGPRDSLMVLVSRVTRFPIGVCRSAIEFTAVAVGWLLGGPLGIGTIISGFGIGVCIQIVFKLVKFDPKTVNHETLDKTFKKLFYRRG